MSVISLNNEQLKKISLDISSLDNTLINGYLPSLESGIAAIRNNVTSTNLIGTLTNIDNKVSEISVSLKTNLSKLEEFLDTQLSSYESNEQTAEDRLLSIISKMGGFVGLTTDKATLLNVNTETSQTVGRGGDFGSDRSGSFGGSISAKYNLNSKNNFNEYVSSFSNLYENTSNSTNGIEATFNAIADTINAPIKITGNTVEFLKNEIINNNQFSAEVMSTYLGDVVDWVRKGV